MPDPKTLEAERQKNYGDPLRCHMAIAKAWDAYLSQVTHGVKDVQGPLAPVPITSVDVANMMALMKIIRAGYNSYHRDNYDDGIVYLGFARRFACGKEEGTKQHSSPGAPSAGLVEDDPT